MIENTKYQLGNAVQNILDNTETVLVINERDVESETELTHFLEHVILTQETYERYPTEDTLSVIIRSETLAKFLGVRNTVLKVLVENSSGEYPNYGRIISVSFPNYYTDEQKTKFANFIKVLEQKSADLDVDICLACKLATEDPWGLLIEQIS